MEEQDAILVVGSNLREEAPILAHRVRKAALAGAEVSFINGREHKYFFDVANSLSGGGLVEMLAGIAVAACGKSLPDPVSALCEGVTASAEQQQIAASLKKADKALVIARQHRRRATVHCRPCAHLRRLSLRRPAPRSAVCPKARIRPARTLPASCRTGGWAACAARIPGCTPGDMLGASLDVLMLVNVEPDADILATDDPVAKIHRRISPWR